MTSAADQLPALARCAHRIRRYALRMGEVQGQGYIGQALGWADVLAVAYGHALNLQPQNPEWEGRDRFLLSHGHYAIAHYAALIEANSGFTSGYGTDEITRRAADLIRAELDADAEVRFVASGTAANALSLAALCRPFESVLAHEHAHSHDDAHHLHTHPDMPTGPHSHWHQHAPQHHVHPHVPDAHHQHRHPS